MTAPIFSGPHSFASRVRWAIAALPEAFDHSLHLLSNMGDRRSTRFANDSRDIVAPGDGHGPGGARVQQRRQQLEREQRHRRVVGQHRPHRRQQPRCHHRLQLSRPVVPAAWAAFHVVVSPWPQAAALQQRLPPFDSGPCRACQLCRFETSSETSSVQEGQGLPALHREGKYS